MAGQGDRQKSEELQQKVLEVKRRAFEEELRRLDEEAEPKARAMVQERLAEDQKLYQEMQQEAQAEKTRAEQLRKAQEDEVHRVLDQDKQTKREVRLREEMTWKRIEEDEKRRSEAKRMKEEVSRQKVEDEKTRQEEEIRRKEESEKKRTELDTLRREQERLRREVEKHERVNALLKSANNFFSGGDYEHAAIEVAKALVNDPTHPDALALDQKIKDLQQDKAKRKVAAERPTDSRVQQRPSSFRTPEAKKPATVKFLIAAIVVGVLVLVSIIVIQVKKKIFTSPVSIAVLPLGSVTNTPEEHILGTAFSGEIIKQFERSKGYTPLGYSSSYRFAQASQNPLNILSRMGFTYVLEGSLGESDNKIFVRLKMVDSSGNTIWQNDYSKPVDLLHEMPERIYQQVTEALNNETGSPVAKSAENPRIINQDAYILYLRGMEMLPRLNPEISQNALQALNQAIALDGLFPQARSGAALLLITRFETGWDTATASLAVARQMAETALKIDPENGDAYCALGELATLEGSYASAQALLDTALTYLPRSSRVYLDRAKLNFRLERYNTVTNAMAHAYELDPRNLDVLQTFGFLHQLMGTPRQGIVYHESALSVADDSVAYLCGPVADIILMDPALTLQYSDRVIGACQQRLKTDSTDYRTMYRMARIEQVTGNSISAMAHFNKLDNFLRKKIQQNPKDGSVQAYLGLTLTRLGRFSEATTYAERALQTDGRNPDIVYAVAQIYSLQMYSSKTKTIDDKKKTVAAQTLKAALKTGYRLDQLTNADFFNMVTHGDLNLALHQPVRPR